MKFSIIFFVLIAVSCEIEKLEPNNVEISSAVSVILIGNGDLLKPSSTIFRSERISAKKVRALESKTFNYTFMGASAGWTYSKISLPPDIITDISSLTIPFELTVSIEAGREYSLEDLRGFLIVLKPDQEVQDQVPTLVINSQDGQAPSDNYKQVGYAFHARDGSDIASNFPSGTARIKNRGQGSRLVEDYGFFKPGLTFNLDAKQSILGMNADKDWVLVSNFFDRSLLRNMLTHSLAQNMGNMGWVASMKNVNLYYNNQFLGLYTIAEKIEVDSDRIALQETAPGDNLSNLLAGSFMVETEKRLSAAEVALQIDSLQTEPPYIVSMYGDNSGSNGSVVIKSPDPEIFGVSNNKPSRNLAIANYIKQYLDAVWTAILDDADELSLHKSSELIEIDSFIDYVILNELNKNVDSNFRFSCFLYKDKNAKLKITIWDFDLAFGNVNFSEMQLISAWRTLHGPWFSKLRTNTEFQNRLLSRYQTLRAGILSDSNISATIDALAAEIAPAALRNFQTFPIFGSNFGAEWLVPEAIRLIPTHEGQVGYLKDWLTQRLEWMDDNLPLF